MNKISKLLLIVILLYGCNNNEDKVYKIILSPIDDISSYIVEYKKDTIIIYEDKTNYVSKNDTLKLYLRNGAYYTKDLNFCREELIMSNLIEKDTVYNFFRDELELFKYEIRIRKDSLITTSIFKEGGIIIDEEKGTTPIYLYLQITYDKDYRIKTITHWDIFETFKADDKEIQQLY